MFKAGDKVISERFGEGVVTCVRSSDSPYFYQVMVKFRGRSSPTGFSPEGWLSREKSPDARIHKIEE